jgi:hypothetical protein
VVRYIGNYRGVSRGGSRILVPEGRQLSDCNNLSGLNPLTNQVLNKKLII